MSGFGRTIRVALLGVKVQVGGWEYFPLHATDKVFEGQRYRVDLLTCMLGVVLACFHTSDLKN